MVSGIMGFAISCQHEDEYGTPMADFVLQGAVKSKTDLHALPDIKVTMLRDSNQTNVNGYYEVFLNDFPNPQTYLVRFHDLDTLHNGNFKDKDTNISFDGNNFQGGDGKWYEGTETKVMDVFLEPKP
jgi:putative lipoprotein (rSAM/lipoprotein system)